MTVRIASICAVTAALALAACGREAEVADAPQPSAENPMVPEMTPTGETAPAFTVAPAGEAPAQPTGSEVPVMTPTGGMKDAVDPNQPSQPAAPVEK